MNERMEKERIIEILNDWNIWHQTRQSGILRSFYLKKIERLKQTGQVITVTGGAPSGQVDANAAVHQQYGEKGH